MERNYWKRMISTILTCVSCLSESEWKIINSDVLRLLCWTMSHRCITVVKLIWKGSLLLVFFTAWSINGSLPVFLISLLMITFWWLFGCSEYIISSEKLISKCSILLWRWIFFLNSIVYNNDRKARWLHSYVALTFLCLQCKCRLFWILCSKLSSLNWAMRILRRRILPNIINLSNCVGNCIELRKSTAEIWLSLNWRIHLFLSLQTKWKVFTEDLIPNISAHHFELLPKYLENILKTKPDQLANTK